MNFIDTHSHIYYDKYKNDIDMVIDRALSTGVKNIICVGVDIPTSIKSIKIAEKYEIVYASVGFHPHESKDVFNKYLYEMEELISHDKVVAVGEIGLDYYYKYSEKNIQIKVFMEQLELAKSLGMPTIIHNRLSDNDLIKCIKQKNIINGVIHCFASNLDFANEIISHGLNLSFTGLITFVKELENIVSKVPLNKIMIETDSPYLTPYPNRGKRNEPSMVKHVAEKIAKIKKISLEKVASETTKTAQKFFGI